MCERERGGEQEERGWGGGGGGTYAINLNNYQAPQITHEKAHEREREREREIDFESLGYLSFLQRTR